MVPNRLSPLHFSTCRSSLQSGADGETRTLVGRIRRAVYETAAVAAEPHRRNGGSPRCSPVLCGLRDRCIAAMLATLVAVRKDRDAKAELNRRGQACEVLADTGIRVAINGRGVGTRPQR